MGFYVFCCFVLFCFPLSQATLLHGVCVGVVVLFFETNEQKKKKKKKKKKKIVTGVPLANKDQSPLLTPPHHATQ
jgi:hypothetical protein